VFWLPVHQLPDAGPHARGRPIVNWIPLEAGEQVQAVLPVRAYDDSHFVFFATRNGMVKKTPLTEFAYRLARGKIAINLDDGDALVDVALTNGQREVMLFASNGKAVRFAESGREDDADAVEESVDIDGAEDSGEDAVEVVAEGEGADRSRRGKGGVRSTGRNSRGVRGIKLAKGESVVSMIVIDGDGDILTASQRGYGKRTPVDEYPCKGRGTQGVIALKTTERNGALVGAIQLSDHHEVLMISDGGTLVRTRAAEISQVGRNTQGVTLMRLAEDETLQTIERVDASLDEVEDGIEGEVPAAPVADAGDAVETPAADA
jgi:DNA gyrase subunit A